MTPSKIEVLFAVGRRTVYKTRALVILHEFARHETVAVVQIVVVRVMNPSSTEGMLVGVIFETF